VKLHIFCNTIAVVPHDGKPVSTKCIALCINLYSCPATKMGWS